ncbi:MAG: transglutaminase domain-containing protein [Thermoflexaceae bacterium]|nr:transglutaminase domain-containing protein [Thermoflexaceae bacterium]
MFWKKKQQKKNDYSRILGLNNTDEVLFSSFGEILLPVSRAILCFLLTVGSICGYASCFGAQFNLAIILLILFAVSVIISFVRDLHSKFIRNSCYIIFLISFTLLILRFYTYVNSGYHAIVNMSYASLENYLDIPALVHYEELIENSYVTITFFLIFLGIFELLLFHMWIGERINLLTVFLISFGPYIVPLFINLMPDTFYLACLLTAYIAIIMIRFSLHINTHPERNKTYSVYPKHNPWSKKIHGFSYGANGISYFMSLFVSFLMSLCILLVIHISLPYSTFLRNSSESLLKAEVTDDVKYIVTFGLSGYFNRYSSTGGLNDGKLGGIYSVRPDYETDLTVRYVPLSSQPVYLRGFVGIGYTDRQWYNADMLLSNNLINSDSYKRLCEDTALITEYSYLSRTFSSRLFRMDITNKGADPEYSYAPYYTNPDSLEIYPSFTSSDYYYFLWNHSRTYGYYPFSIDYADTFHPKSEESSFNPYPYLQVPDSTRREILTFLNNNDLCVEYITKSSGEYRTYSESELQSVINRVSNCLSTEFVYSLNPGITPNNQDYVGYFLNNNQKGFCAHFATSAVLIFRTLGIPARYVEGYVLTSEDLQEGTLVSDASVSDYIDTSYLSGQISDSDLSVVDVDIADDKAHAWVEYYDPYFGWKVFEATTASLESSSSDSDFWSALYSLFNQTSTADDAVVMEENTISSNSLTSAISVILLAAFGILIFLMMSYFGWHYIRQYRSYHRNRRNINVRNYYKIICRYISRHYPEFDYILTFEQQLEFIHSHYRLCKKLQNNSLLKLAALLEQAAFSNREMTSTEYQFSMKLLKLLRRNVVLHF